MLNKLYEKAICSECAGVSLGKYIELCGENETCDYCKSSKKFVMTIEQLLPRMYKSWELYFSNFDDSSFHEEFRTPYYLSDIVDEIEVELNDANEKFIFDLKNIPEDRIWQKDSEYWTPFSEALRLSWERFCTIVKTQWRYTYFLCENDSLDPASYSPTDTLENICMIIKSKDKLILEIPSNTPIFRCRKIDYKIKIDAKSLGTSPSKYAKANRFSPKGIPMFYGSLDEKTCKTEVCRKGEYPVVGEFYNSRPIKVLDLTKIPQIPNLYDDDFNFIPALEFLHEFADSIGKRNTSENDLDYIPTQVFTEYIRRSLHDLNLKGIKYRSAENPDGINLALFYTNAECINEAEYNGMSDSLVFKTVLNATEDCKKFK